MSCHSTLNWNTHINKTAQRANTTSAFLHRNIRTCPRKTKHLAYTTLVRPILEYASIIWDPHTVSNIHKLETVQRRSARHIMHNHSRHASVTTMLQHLDLPTLQQRRQHSKNHYAIQNYTQTSQHYNRHRARIKLKKMHSKNCYTKLILCSNLHFCVAIFSVMQNHRKTCMNSIK